MIMTMIIAALCLLIGWVSGVAFIGLPLLRVLEKEACSSPFVFGVGKGVYAVKYMGELEMQRD